MKKLFSFFAIACGVVLFASCESSEAITRNLLKHNDYNYNLAYAAQFVDETCQTVTDTVSGIDEEEDTVYTGRYFRMELYTPGIAVDTTEDGDTAYTYPADKRFAQIGMTLLSPGLDRICEGTYEIGSEPFTKYVLGVVDPDDFYKATEVGILRDTVGMDGYYPTPPPKLVNPTDMFEYTDYIRINEGTVEVKQGMMGYDITIDAIDQFGGPVYARYTGIVAKWPLYIWDLYMWSEYLWWD